MMALRSLAFLFFLFTFPALAANDPLTQSTPISGRVQVLYVTDRKRSDETAPTAMYGDERGQLHFGRCSVRFKAIPGMGSLAEYIPLAELNEWEELEAVQAMGQDEFYATLANATPEVATEPSKKRQRLVFVHGYNFSFAKACRRAGALQMHLGPSFEIVLYSWPSDSKLLNYTRDLADVDWGAPHLKALFTRLQSVSNGEPLHILSHSLGNRGVFQALSTMSCRAGQAAPFGRWIMAAPDLDSDRFRRSLPQLRTIVSNITRYVSANDAPLKLSQQVHGYPRLGQAGEDLQLFDGVETVDVSGTSLYEITGHRYYRYNPLVLDDLRQLLLLGWPASRRARLQQKALGQQHYWRLLPAGNG